MSEAGKNLEELSDEYEKLLGQISDRQTEKRGLAAELEALINQNINAGGEGRQALEKLAAERWERLQVLEIELIELDRRCKAAKRARTEKVLEIAELESERRDKIYREAIKARDKAFADLEKFTNGGLRRGLSSFEDIDRHWIELETKAKRLELEAVVAEREAARARTRRDLLTKELE